MNYRNDLDECLIFFLKKFESTQLQNFFGGMFNLLSCFNKLLGKKVPKLLESYNMTI